MIKALWFALKAALVIAAALWVAERPGSVRIEWMAYVFTLDMGFFLLVLLGLILLGIFIYQTIRLFADFPNSWRRYHVIKGHEKGLKALTVGLSAVAAGDGRAARTQAKKALKYIPDDGDDGLALLLAAQAARLEGDEEKANGYFLKLLETPDASFLGVRGLLQSALDARDYETAQRLTHRALALNPKQKWILATAYDLSVRAREWDKALGLLKKLERLNADQPKDKARERAAIHVAQAREYLEKNWNEAALEELKKARKSERSFAPATLDMAALYLGREDFKRARRTLEKAARVSMHDAYVAAWEAVYDGRKKVDVLAKLKHMEVLVKLAPANARALRAAGRAALDAGLWGDAREYFERSEMIAPSAGLYRHWAELERVSEHDVEAARAKLEQAVDAPSDKCWVCGVTGRVFERWQSFVPVSAGLGEVFNTLEWRLPDLGSDDIVLLDQPVEGDKLAAPAF